MKIPEIRIENKWTVVEVLTGEDIRSLKSGKAVQICAQYSKGIRIERRDGKHSYPQEEKRPSVANILSLSAGRGTALTIKVEGDDEKALKLAGELYYLFNRNDSFES